MNLFAPSLRSARNAAVVATCGFAAIAVFELALAFGAPMGHAAYGGITAQLSAGERAVSVVAVIVWLPLVSILAIPCALARRAAMSSISATR